jgi:hypothetical protein
MKKNILQRFNKRKLRLGFKLFQAQAEQKLRSSWKKNTKIKK